jgi:hypothetical protein
MAFVSIYCFIEPVDLPQEWPNAGSVEFKNVLMPLCCDEISIDVHL